MPQVREVAGWGNVGRSGRIIHPGNLTAATTTAQFPNLSRGLGRSYGDASLPAVESDLVLDTTAADRVVSFEPASGRLKAEAGISLAEIVRLYYPLGFFPPVTPGTKFVTLGGMVASDVHGKNHHVAGCIGAHVEQLTIRLPTGDIQTCGPSENTDLFNATCGGMGLTGHILDVTLTLEKIPSPWIYWETRRVPDIETYVRELKEAAPHWPYTMGWIDCVSGGRATGRGIIMMGRWATPSEAPPARPGPTKQKTFPLTIPFRAVTPLTSRLFNALYFNKHPKEPLTGLVSPEAFFYPLDAILHWNRAYGPWGFTQHQCVLPNAAGPEAPRRFLELLTKSGAASPLCVIKDCGPQGSGMLSFPTSGTSIALDLPIRPETQSVVDDLNRFVIDHGGRIYLTKDSFTRAEHFRAMDPRVPLFEEKRRQWDPEGHLRSALSERIFAPAA